MVKGIEPYIKFSKNHYRYLKLTAGVVCCFRLTHLDVKWCRVHCVIVLLLAAVLDRAEFTSFPRLLGHTVCSQYIVRSNALKPTVLTLPLNYGPQNIHEWIHSSKQPHLDTRKQQKCHTLPETTSLRTV